MAGDLPFRAWARYWGQVKDIAFEKDSVRGGGQRRPAENKRKSRIFSRRDRSSGGKGKAFQPENAFVDRICREIVSNSPAEAALTLRKKRGFSVCLVAGRRSRDYQSDPHFLWGIAPGKTKNGAAVSGSPVPVRDARETHLLFLSVSCMTSIMRASGFFLQAARKASSVFWLSRTDFSVTL